MTAKRKSPPGPIRRTIYELLTEEVIPRLKVVEGEVQVLKEDVKGVKGDVASVKQEVHDAGIGNGHAVLLAEFLEDQAARKKRSQAYAEVGGDLRSRFQFLMKPQRWAGRAAVFVAAAVITGYSSAVFLGKATFPPIPWPFHS